jgi:HSP20 family protein
MTLVTWEPMRGLTRLQDEMNRLWRDAVGTLDRPNAGDRLFSPPVDIIEQGDNIVLVADVPGLTRDQIELSVENRALTISGERAPLQTEGAAVFHTERGYGKFSRVFSLPATVDVERISAEYREGVLRVTLPKAEAAKPRKIDVRVDG